MKIPNVKTRKLIGDVSGCAFVGYDVKRRLSIWTKKSFFQSIILLQCQPAWRSQGTLSDLHPRVSFVYNPKDFDSNLSHCFRTKRAAKVVKANVEHDSEFKCHLSEMCSKSGNIQKTIQKKLGIDLLKKASFLRSIFWFWTDFYQIDRLFIPKTNISLFVKHEWIVRSNFYS